MTISEQEVLNAVAKLNKRKAYRVAKRLFDMGFSATLILLFWWLYVAIGIAVKLDSPGPALFMQQRVGKNGKLFPMVKFRSMSKDAEQRLESLQDLNERDGPVFKIRDDPRITRVGRFIRRTNLDELPQFVNVLLGHMSIVGPRPALPHEVEQYTNLQKLRLLVKPGITCFWQVDPRRDDITFDEWIQSDLAYIQQCGLWTDLQLIIRTIGTMIGAQNS